MSPTPWSERRRTPLVVGDEDRPRLRDGVALIEPSSTTGSAWLITDDDVPVARVPLATAEVLRLLDGSRSLSDIRGTLSADPTDLSALVSRLQASGLLEGSPERRGRGVVRVIPPLTVQVASARLTPAFAAVARALRPLVRRAAVRRAVLVVLVALLLAGLASGLLLAPVVADVTARPLSLASLVAIAAALVLATGVHELAHGVALHLSGGTVRRAGIMLFYLSPAFFVDVTDGWRLASRRRRVAVALAGPAVHAAVASAAALIALALDAGEARDALLGFAVAAAGIALVNLLPFVRFDGYFALVAATDTPHLRRRALEALDALVVGVEGDRRIWLALLGLGSLVVPVVLTLAAFGRLIRWAAPAGAVGGTVVLGVMLLLVGVAVVQCARWIARPGARVRRLALLVALVASVLTAGLTVPVPSTVAVGYVLTSEGAWLVSTDRELLDSLDVGSDVRLQTQGLLRHSDTGRGTVGAVTAVGPVGAPLESLAPARLPGSVVAVASRPLALDDGPLPPPAGAAIVRTGGDRPALLAAVLAPIRIAFAPAADVLCGISSAGPCSGSLERKDAP